MPDHMAGRPFEADVEVSDSAVIVAFRGEFDLAAKEAAAAALADALAAGGPAGRVLHGLDRDLLPAPDQGAGRSPRQADGTAERLTRGSPGARVDRSPRGVRVRRGTRPADHVALGPVTAGTLPGRRIGLAPGYPHHPGAMPERRPRPPVTSWPKVTFSRLLKNVLHREGATEPTRAGSSTSGSPCSRTASIPCPSRPELGRHLRDRTGVAAHLGAALGAGAVGQQAPRGEAGGLLAPGPRRARGLLATPAPLGPHEARRPPEGRQVAVLDGHPVVGPGHDPALGTADQLGGRLDLDDQLAAVSRTSRTRKPGRPSIASATPVASGIVRSLPVVAALVSRNDAGGS